MLSIYCAGDITNNRPSPVTTEDLEFDSREVREYFSTGYYLLPGQQMTIEVLSLDDDTWHDFQVRQPLPDTT